MSLIEGLGRLLHQRNTDFNQVPVVPVEPEMQPLTREEMYAQAIEEEGEILAQNLRSFGMMEHIGFDLTPVVANTITMYYERIEAINNRFFPNPPSETDVNQPR